MTHVSWEHPTASGRTGRTGHANQQAAPAGHLSAVPAGNRSVPSGLLRVPAAGWAIVLAVGFCGALGGCGSSQAKFNTLDRHGRTYYIDGAGNWGYGVVEVQEGLRKAGYQGNIIIYGWSSTFNPALDQTVGRPFARAKGQELGRQITKYCEKFPHNQVNIIALSAGTGVGVWGCENVQPPAKVSNLIMLGSSLSSTYDMQKALKNISGGAWVYYSPNDAVLDGPVRALGTIDGELGGTSAGLVGLKSRSGKIHNIAWSRSYTRYGWTGGHTDATSVPFVRNVLARHIISQSEPVSENP